MGRCHLHHSSVAHLRLLSLNWCTSPCRTRQIASIAFGSGLAIVAHPCTHLFIDSSKPVARLDAVLSTLHPRSMMKFGTLSAIVTISCEARTRGENESNSFFSQPREFPVAETLWGPPGPGRGQSPAPWNCRWRVRF